MSTHQNMIQLELDKIAVKLRESISDDRYTNLYSAQVALAWVMDHKGTMSPYDAIMNGEVQPLIKGGCSEFRVTGLV